MTNGTPIVFGIPKEIKPIIGSPEGRMRLRFRNTKAGRAYFKTPNGIREFVLKGLITDDHWEIDPMLEQGMNLRK